MARQFCFGFESGGVAEGTTGGTAPTISSAQAYGGTYSCYVNVSAGTGTSYIRLGGYSTTGAPTNISIDQAWLKFMYRPSTTPSSLSEEIAEVMTTGDVLKCAIRLKYTGTNQAVLQLYGSDGTTQIGSDGTTTLSTGTWYRIEVFAGVGSSTKAELRCNGNVEVNSSTASISSSNTGYLRLGKAVNRNSIAIGGYYDDASCDNTEWCGDTKIEALTPNGNGTDTGWTASAGNKYDCLNDVPYDDTGDYIYSATNPHNYTATLSDCSANVTNDILAVQLFARLKENSSSASSTALRYRTGGTAYDLTVGDPSTTVVTRGQCIWQNPYYQRYWKKSEVDALEAGVINRSTKQINVYALHVFVEYRVGATVERPTVEFFAGFELGNGNDCYSLNSNAEIQSTVVYSGSYALRIYSGGAGYVTARDNDWSASQYWAHKQLFSKFMFRVGTAPSADSEEIFAIVDSVGGTNGSVRIDSNRKLSVYDSTETIIGSAGSTVLALDTWYSIGVMFHIGSSAAYELRINGTTELSGSASNFGTNNIAIIAFGRYTNRNSRTVVAYYDDCVVYANDFPDPWAVVKRFTVDGNGSFTTGWTPSTGALYECIDEVPPSATDYIYSTTANSDYTCSLNSSATSGIVGNIYAIAASSKIRSGATSSTGKIIIYRNGHFMRASTATVLSSGDTYRFYYPYDFGTAGSQWTTSVLDGIEIGERCVGTDQLNVDALLLEALFFETLLSPSAGLPEVAATGLAATAAASSAAPASAGMPSVAATALDATAQNVSATQNATATLAEITVDGLAATAAGTGTAAATGGLPEVAVAGLQPSAAPSSAAPAAAALATVDTTALSATAAPSSAAAVSATLPEVAAAALVATAAPSSAAPATSTLATVDATALVATGAGTGTAAATATLPAVAVEGLQPTGTGAGTASATAAMPTVDIAALGATATPGTAAASAGIATVDVAALAPTAAGTGTAGATATLPTVSAEALGATALSTLLATTLLPEVATAALPATAAGTGTAAISATLADVSVDGLQATVAATGTAPATATLPSVSAEALDATAQSTLLATATLPEVAVTALAPTASGTGTAACSATLPAVAVEGLQPTVAATGTAPATATMPTVAATALDATAAPGPSSATAGIATVTAEALDATAVSSLLIAYAGIADVGVAGLDSTSTGTGTAAVSASLATVDATSLQPIGSGSGAVNVSAAMATVDCSSMDCVLLPGTVSVQAGIAEVLAAALEATAIGAGTMLANATIASVSAIALPADAEMWRYVTDDVWTVPQRGREWKVPHIQETWLVPNAGKIWTVPHVEESWTVPERGTIWSVQ